mgnify:CR=1 FL=1
MIEFLTYTIVSIILLIIGGLLIINMLLANVKNNLEELHKIHNDIIDKK